MKRSAWLYRLLAVTLVISSTGLGWAEVKPGGTITKDNLTQAEDLLTPSTRWMVERGMPMSIIETKKVNWPKAYREATEKYSGQVQISADGKEISNYVAGAPFPNIDINDPLAGFKIMWNHEQPPYLIDNFGTELLIEMVNSKGEIERTYESPWRTMMWTGRLYIDPKPVVPHNPPIRRTEVWGPVVYPNDKKGLSILSFRYLSPDKPDDFYLYVAERRRIVRFSIADRGNQLGGMDYDIDSFYGFNGKIN